MPTVVCLTVDEHSRPVAMLLTPFLTQLDPRGKVKGSRDPLGIQSIWTRFGRHVVGNLTTVSSSVRDFTTLLLGYYFAERLAADDAQYSEVATFLKFEQLAAYARVHVNNDKRSIRGTERVQKALSEGTRVSISADAACQILGNQKIYGLWGLYTVPGRSSGLLHGDPTRLTDAGRDLVEGFYLPLLNEQGGVTKRIVDILGQRTARVDVEASDVIQALARVLKPRLLAKERVAFQHHLLFGGPDDSTEGRQRQLASLFTETLKDAEFRWTPEALLALEKSSRGRGDEWRALADRLHDIRVCESVVAPSVALFIHLLGMDGKPVADAVARLRENWGSRLAVTPIDAVRQLEPKLAAGDADAGKRWVAVAESAATGDYQTLIELLVEVNRVVMAARGSTPWLEIRNGHFHVRFHEERGELPGRDDIATMWRYSYFLDSLRSVADQIGGAS